MKREEIYNILKRVPAVHVLIHGAFIQEPLEYSTNLIAIPLKPMGFDQYGQYLATYSLELSGNDILLSNYQNLLKEASESQPVIAVVCHSRGEESLNQLEQNANSEIDRAIETISWTSSSSIEKFGVVVKNSSESVIRLIPPSYTKKYRLGFGNTGKDFSNTIQRLYSIASKDERLGFALALYRDANHERNPQFKIARYFNVLECLASKLKKEDVKSRKAVKQLLGLKDGANAEINLNEKKYKYDVIEIAGRIRDKLFHGVEFSKSDLNAENRAIFEIYDQVPERIASTLQTHCELEISRWSNNASNGQIKTQAQ